jgi:methionyl-tRNA synthetase
VKNFLLTGAAPTPNGRLHLGHIGAQFLKLDVLKRHTIRAGGKATLLFSIDAFDTPIHLASIQSQITEAAVCRHYFAEIAQDLQHAAIDYDVFLDTSAGEGRDIIKEAADKLDVALTGRKVAVTEPIPHSRRNGSPVTGRLLTGDCPRCGRTMHGYSCDPCGLHLSPEQIRNARSADPADSLEWRQVTNHFIRADTRLLRGYIDSVSLPPVTRGRVDDIAGIMIKDPFLARWTATEPWGLGTGVPGQVYFNRMLITLAEQVVFGELTRNKLGLHHNPFEEGSDVTTVLAYGADNLGGFLIENSALALATETYRPFDHHLVSEFYLVDGEKMATSRPDDAIWVADVAGLPGFSRDGLRAYMSSIATPDTEIEVSRAALTRFMAGLSPRIDRIVASSASADQPKQIDAAVLTLATESLDRQSKALELTHIDLPLLWQAVAAWMDRVLSGCAGDPYTNLACFAVIAYPIAPDVASDVWRLLQREGKPDRAGLRKLASDGT